MESNRFSSISLPPSLAGAAGEYVFDRAAVRELDRAAVDEFQIPSVLLMENAATALTHVAHSMGALAPGGALIVCGPGNNGGDGFALARKLSNLGVSARVVVLCDRERFRGDAATNLTILERMDLPIAFVGDDDAQRRLGEEWVRLGARGVLVDAMFGTGMTSPARAPFDDAIRWMNAKRISSSESTAVLAVDLPSGLDCDRGVPIDGADETTVRADVTVTLAGLKRGLLHQKSLAYTGCVLSADIGAPRALVERLGSPLGRDPRSPES